MAKKKIMKKIDLKEIPLGTKLRDTVTGFVGIAIAKVLFLNGCVQYSLKPKLDKDGKVQEALTVDCQQLEIVDDKIETAPTKKKGIGGIMPDTPNTDY